MRIKEKQDPAANLMIIRFVISLFIKIFFTPTSKSHNAEDKEYNAPDEAREDIGKVKPGTSIQLSILKSGGELSRVRRNTNIPLSNQHPSQGKEKKEKPEKRHAGGMTGMRL